MALPSLGALRLGDRRAASTSKLATVYATTWHVAFAHEVQWREVIPKPVFEVRYKLKNGTADETLLKEFLTEVGKQVKQRNYEGCFLDEQLTIPLATTEYAVPTERVRLRLAEKLTKEAMEPDGPKLYLEGLFARKHKAPAMRDEEYDSDPDLDDGPRYRG